MKLIQSPKQLNQILTRLRQQGKTVGFVPTMGALHAGHLSLIKASNRENDVTVVSIFVNPTQFGPKEDFKKYPRSLHEDQQLLAEAKTDYLFYPSVQAMYPHGLEERLKIKGAKWPQLAKGLCGKFRPGHFQGVVTVVAKLLNAVGPCRLYLGAKDYQQVAVIRQMVKDLDHAVRRGQALSDCLFPEFVRRGVKVEVRICPTVREKDGFAMSSRNQYLSSDERKRALEISRTLFQFRRDARKRQMGLACLCKKAIRSLKQSVDRVQYFEVVDPVTLTPLKKIQKQMVALTACFVGKTRLIDNVIIPSSHQ